MEKAKVKAKSKYSIEEGFLKLNSILEQMDSSEVSLEDSFNLYNDGILIVKELNEKLSDVEAKLTVVNE